MSRICMFCDDFIESREVELTDPWGKVYGFAHWQCADNQEDGDPDLNAVSAAERQEMDYHNKLRNR